MRKNIVILLAMALGLLAIAPSCGNGSNVGKYVYLCGDVLHCDKDCPGLAETKDEHGHRIYGMEVLEAAHLKTRLNLQDIKYCPRCINDATYEHLQSLW